MRKVKNEYEKCADAYRNTMKEINEQKSAEVFTTTTTTVTPPSIVQISLMKRQLNESKLMKRQQSSSQSIYVSLETTTSAPVNAAKNTSSEAIDQGEVQIKRVCWSVLPA